MAQDLTAMHIGQASGAYEPQRKNAFSFEVDVPYAGGKELIRLSLAKAFVPEYISETFAINFLNEQVQFAGKPTNIGEGVIELHDYVDQNVRNAILSWYYLVYNPTNGAVGLAKTYKRDAYILMFGPDGSNTRLWQLKGAFPSKVNAASGGLDYKENDASMISVTIKYDKALPLKGNGSPESIPGVNIGEGGGVSFNGVSL